MGSREEVCMVVNKHSAPEKYVWWLFVRGLLYRITIVVFLLWRRYIDGMLILLCVLWKLNSPRIKYKIPLYNHCIPIYLHNLNMKTGTPGKQGQIHKSCSDVWIVCVLCVKDHKTHKRPGNLLHNYCIINQ